MNTAIFDALPGVVTPVADVRRALAAIWDVEPTRGKAAPSEFRASQMNLVVHFGLDTSADQAREGFATALAFSRLHPCRTLALCPRPPERGGDVAAKIFCECYIGKSRHEMICSEAIVLTYPLEQRTYLESQASIMLESDLPLYYWPQRISRASRLADYRFFLREAQRIVIDSAVEKPEVVEFGWPRKEAVHDLVHARLLSVRQQAGHFLSYIAPFRIVEGLRRVEVTHGRGLAAEGRCFARWLGRGIAGCATDTGENAAPPIVELAPEPAADAVLSAEWSYACGDFTRLHFDFARAVSHLESSRTPGGQATAGAARLLDPERALAEALFF